MIHDESFRSVSPEFGEETAGYVTSGPYKWWQFHKYPLTELAALSTLVTFFWFATGASGRLLRRK